AFAVTVALGLRYLGVLLMGSLVIIPAATAKRLAGNLHTMLIVAILVAVVSTLAGTWIGMAIDRETGPPIVMVAATFFLLSLLAARPTAK
ncbi:MAG: metal ABC transporter permease, partial [Pseudomonadota bacterium]